jgi:hypothetical protein
MSKREKHVFSTDEIPHLWAHQTKSDARNQADNLYFKGATIYSYGSHFPIAQHVTNKRKQKAILFTTRQYSVTTSGHINAVRGAIPKGATVFYVPLQYEYNYSDSGDKLCQHFRNEIADSYAKALKAKGQRASYIRQMIQSSEDGKAFAKFFGFKKEAFPLPVTGKKLKDWQTSAIEAERLHNDNVAARHKSKSARWQAAREREAQEMARTLDERIETWRNGGHARFAYGEHVPTMLRIEGADVVTSQGARFPIAHAKRGLVLVEACISSRRDWQTNGHSCHLGHYRIETITAEGTVTAGCHVVTYPEIARVADAIRAYSGDAEEFGSSAASSPVNEVQ